ncbi:MAG: hypothetical protein WC829_01735 [Hyphomicrobium sp.]|jgi:hypothetical protein
MDANQTLKRAAELLRDFAYVIPLGPSHDHIGKIASDIDALAAQEPHEKLYETIIAWDEGGGKRSRRDLARRIEKLYTAHIAKLEVELAEALKDAERWRDESNRFPRAEMEL